MAKAQGYEQAWLGGARNPSTFDWIVAIFLIAVQAGVGYAINAFFFPRRVCRILIETP